MLLRLIFINTIAPLSNFTSFVRTVCLIWRRACIWPGVHALQPSSWAMRNWGTLRSSRWRYVWRHRTLTLKIKIKPPYFCEPLCVCSLCESRLCMYAAFFAPRTHFAFVIFLDRMRGSRLLRRACVHWIALPAVVSNVARGCVVRRTHCLPCLLLRLCGATRRLVTNVWWQWKPRASPL